MSFHLERAIELIDLAKAKGRLAHAYLLIGPPGSGKERLAMHIVQMADAVPRPNPPETLDDLRSQYVAIVSPESRARRISIASIRSLEHILQTAAPSGVTKFAIIRDADRMGSEASNAFLKTLEEPPANSRLLLLTSRPDMLLDTILSRCIRVPLLGTSGPLSYDESVREFLSALADHAQEPRPRLAGALALMTQFSNLLKSIKREVEKANDEAAKAEIAHYRNTTEGTYLKQREDYWSALAASEYLDRRQRLLEYLIIWFGDALRQKHGGKSLDLPEFSPATSLLAQRYSDDDLLVRLAAAEALRDRLNTNVNESLALEVAFIKAFA